MFYALLVQQGYALLHAIPPGEDRFYYFLFVTCPKLYLCFTTSVLMYEDTLPPHTKSGKVRLCMRTEGHTADVDTLKFVETLLNA